MYSVTIVTSVHCDMERVLLRITLEWEKLCFPLQLKPFIITQWNCTSIGSCSPKKQTNGSVVAHEPMAMQPAIARQNGWGVWLYKWLRRRSISDFFKRSDWGVQLIARPGTNASASSRAVFNESAPRLVDCNDSNGGPFRALSTVGKSQGGTVWGHRGFVLLAPRKNWTTPLFLPTNRPAIGALKAAMAAV